MPRTPITLYPLPEHLRPKANGHGRQCACPECWGETTDKETDTP